MRPVKKGSFCYGLPIIPRHARTRTLVEEVAHNAGLLVVAGQDQWGAVVAQGVAGGQQPEVVFHQPLHRVLPSSSSMGGVID